MAFEKLLAQEKIELTEFLNDWLIVILRSLQAQKREIEFFEKTKQPLSMGLDQLEMNLKNKGLLWVLLDQSVERTQMLLAGKYKWQKEHGSSEALNKKIEFLRHQKFYFEQLLICCSFENQAKPLPEPYVKYQSIIEFLKQWLTQRLTGVMHHALVKSTQLVLSEVPHLKKNESLQPEYLKRRVYQNMGQLMGLNAGQIKNLSTKWINDKNFNQALASLTEQVQQLVKKIPEIQPVHTRSLLSYIKSKEVCMGFEYHLPDKYWEVVATEQQINSQQLEQLKKRTDLFIKQTGQLWIDGWVKHLNQLDSLFEQLDQKRKGIKNKALDEHLMRLFEIRFWLALLDGQNVHQLTVSVMDKKMQELMEDGVLIIGKVLGGLINEYMQWLDQFNDGLDIKSGLNGVLVYVWSSQEMHR